MWRFGIAIALLLLLIVMVAGLLFNRTEASSFMQRLSSRTSWYPIETEGALYANRSTLVDTRVSGLPHSSREFIEPGAAWTDDVRRSLLEVEDAAKGKGSTSPYARIDDANLARLNSLWPGGYPLADPDKSAPAAGVGSARQKMSGDPDAPADGAPRGVVSTTRKMAPPPLLSTRHIADVQRKLAALGYYPGPADGRTGARTQVAVRAFQRDAHLPMDGRIDGPLLNHIDAESKIRLSMRQQELEAMAPAPATKPERQQERGVFGTVLGGLQRMMGRDFNSVRHPDEITAYCRGNVDTWIYDFGREAFVYCGNVITGAAVEQSVMASGGGER